jgi:hypothetical protein
VQANLPLAIYGIVLMGVIVLAPGGIQGAVSRLVRLARARVMSTPNREGA